MIKNIELLKISIVLIVITALTGCAYNAKVLGTSAPTSEIRPDKQVNINISYFIENELINLNRNIKPTTLVCSAHNFPIDAGDAIKSSITKILDGTFTHVVASSSKNISSEEGKYKFIFSLDTYQPSLRFSSGFWQAHISSASEIVIKVLVLDDTGKEIVRTTISGDGSAESDGDCPDGAQVIADASQKAIKRMLENFVYKVINTDFFTKKS